MKEIFGEIWNGLIFETVLGRELRNHRISILYEITDPDLSMYIDWNGAVFGKAAKAKKPAITQRMSSDTVHKFLLKKIDMAKAVSTQQIKARGAVTKLLRLLPLLDPVQEKYPAYCRKYDLPMN